MKLFLILLLILTTMSSCEDDGEQAVESIIGSWRLVEAKSFYGEFTQNGHNGLDVVEERADLGFFRFERDFVTYNYMRNDTIFEDSTSWNLTSEKIRSGFFRETEYTLALGNEISFQCAFGNETKNSQRNATMITLFQDPIEPGPGVAIELSLAKN